MTQLTSITMRPALLRLRERLNLHRYAGLAWAYQLLDVGNGLGRHYRDPSKSAGRHID
jgi:hypothetical protein